jgi:hypothetical protein
MHQQVFQQIRNLSIIHHQKNLLEKVINKYIQEIIHIVEEVIQVIPKIVLQQQQYLHQNVHYIHHVLIVIANNVHHFRIIENQLGIRHRIHHRQIQLFIKKSIMNSFIIDLVNKNNLYQPVDPIHILNHYQRRRRRKLQYNEKELWQSNDEGIYLVIVHFGQKHNHNNRLI